MGGAGVAQGSDESVAWINPAGLGAIDRHTLSLSLNAYGFHAIQVDDHFGEQTAGGYNDAGYSRTLLLYPASLGLFFNLGQAGQVGHQVFALSFFTLSSETTDYSAALRRAGLIDLAHQLDWISDENTYALGVGYAVTLPARFRLGASLYVHWVEGRWRQTGTLDRFNAVNWDQLGVSWTDIGDSIDVGLIANVGAQWHSRHLSVGLSLRPPRVRLHSRSSGHYQAFRVDGKASGTAAGTRVLTTYHFSEIAEERLFDTNLGLAVRWPDRLVIELNATLHAALKSRGTNTIAYDQLAFQGTQAGQNQGENQNFIDYRTTWGAALGVELDLGPMVLLAGGFIDNTTRVLPAANEASGLLYAFDIYGISLGAGFGRQRGALYLGAQYINGHGDYLGGEPQDNGEVLPRPRSARDHRLLVLLSGSVGFWGDNR